MIFHYSGTVINLMVVKIIGTEGIKITQLILLELKINSRSMAISSYATKVQLR